MPEQLQVFIFFLSTMHALLHGTHGIHLLQNKYKLTLTSFNTARLVNYVYL